MNIYFKFAYIKKGMYYRSSATNDLEFKILTFNHNEELYYILSIWVLILEMDFSMH